MTFFYLFYLFTSSTSFTTALPHSRTSSTSSVARLAMTPQFYSSLKHLDTSTLRHCFLYTQTLLLRRFLTTTTGISAMTASAATGCFKAPTMGVRPHRAAVLRASCSAMKAAAGGDTL